VRTVPLHLRGLEAAAVAICLEAWRWRWLAYEEEDTCLPQSQRLPQTSRLA